MIAEKHKLFFCFFIAIELAVTTSSVLPAMLHGNTPFSK